MSARNTDLGKGNATRMRILRIMAFQQSTTENSPETGTPMTNINQADQTQQNENSLSLSLSLSVGV